MNTSTQLTYYNSYLLRIWNEGAPDETPVWRFSLQDTRTQTKQGFPTLEKLFTALQNELARGEVEGTKISRIEISDSLL